MIAMFNYMKSEEQIFNDIVDGVLESLQRTMAGVKDTRSYAELQTSINDNVALYLTQGTRYEAKYKAMENGREILKNPQVTRNRAVREKFDAVIAQIINAALPTSTSRTYGNEFIEVHQIGWGDTARFITTSNDLFKVNEIAEGIHRATLQPIYNNEVTVNCGTVEIATSADWYAIAAGVFNWGDFALRASRSFEGYIMLKSIAAMVSATTKLGSAWSIAGLAKWSELTEKVSAANGGSSVYGLGTIGALGKVLPTVEGFQVGLGEEVVKVGYLDRYQSVRLVPVDQFIVPGTVNTSVKLGVPSDTIFLIAADQFKPVKAVFEGDSVVVESLPGQTTDKTYGMSIQFKIGIAAVVGSKFGTVSV